MSSPALLVSLSYYTLENTRIAGNEFAEPRLKFRRAGFNFDPEVRRHFTSPFQILLLCKNGGEENVNTRQIDTNSHFTDVDQVVILADFVLCASTVLAQPIMYHENCLFHLFR